MLIKTLAAVAAGTVLSTSAFAQSATEVRGPSRTSHRDALDATHQMRRTQWFKRTNQATPFLDQYCRKTSSGSRSRRRLAVVAGDSTQAEPYVIRV